MKYSIQCIYILLSILYTFVVCVSYKLFYKKWDEDVWLRHKSCCENLLLHSQIPAFQHSGILAFHQAFQHSGILAFWHSWHSSILLFFCHSRFSKREAFHTHSIGCWLGLKLIIVFFWNLFLIIDLSTAVNVLVRL